MGHAATAAMAALMLGAAMQPAFAQSTVAPQHPGDPGYDTLLDAATAPVRSQFGAAIRVDVERLDRLGRWAFLQGVLRDADGSRPDYTGTSYAERAEQGGMSDVYVALLQAPQGVDADASIDTATDALEVPGANDGTTDSGASGPSSAPEWILVDHAIGPSDVSWLTWSQDHAAPRQLFGF